MPHPEAYHHWTNHPDWTRIKASAQRQNIDPHPGPTVGIQLLKNAVDFVKQN
jgi:phosphoribosylformylglycinamidine synthase